MRPALLGLALATLAACGAAPSNDDQVTRIRERNDPSYRDPGGGRSESYTPARDPGRSNHSGKK